MTFHNDDDDDVDDDVAKSQKSKSLESEKYTELQNVTDMADISV